MQILRHKAAEALGYGVTGAGNHEIYITDYIDLKRNYHKMAMESFKYEQ
jgi:hypothetical protein